MNRKRFEEILPWYLNGSLSPEERQEIHAWLASSSEGREALGQVLQAARIFQAEPSPEELVDYAQRGKASEGFDAWIRSDPENRELLEMARESFRRMEESESEAALSAGGTKPSGGFWRPLAIAASLAVVLVGYALWRTSQESRLLQGNLIEAQARLEELRQPPQPQPSFNTEVVDLFPADLALRSQDVQETLLEVGKEVAQVTLILNSGNFDEYPSFGVRLENDQGTAWSGQGLQRHAQGDFTLSIPTQTLAPGSWKLLLEGIRDGQTTLLETYPFRVQRR